MSAAREMRGRSAGMRGLTVIEMVIVLFLLAILFNVFVFWARARGRRMTRWHCNLNLRHICLMARMYTDRYQGWPDASGSDFLIRLSEQGFFYPEELICPATRDGLDARGFRVAAHPGLGRMPANRSSYAGRRNAVPSAYPGLFTARGSYLTVIASDDDEGPGPRYNHGDGVVVAFADGHCEEIPLDRPDLGGFGQGGLLDPLGN